MSKILPILLFISIVSGQLIKLPVNGYSGPILLDLSILVLCALGLLQLKGKLRKPNPILFSLLIFSAVCFISLIFTPLNLTFNEYIKSFSYLIRFLGFVLFSWILYSGGLNSIKQNFLKIFFYSTLTLSILGLLQLAIYPDLKSLTEYGWDPHYFRTVSTFLDPNFLGSFLTIGLLLLATKQIQISSKLHKIFFIIIFLSVVTTFSRGSALMMTSSFLILSILLKSFRIFTLTIILSLCFTATFLVQISLISIPRNIDRTQSASYRIDAWQQGLKIFETYPFFGVGFNSYKYAINQLGLAHGSFIESRGATTNDSSLIYILATTGVIGLAIYLNLIWQILHSNFVNFKQGNIMSAIFFSSTIGFILQSFFSNTLFYPFILLWILAAAIPFKTFR